MTGAGRPLAVIYDAGAVSPQEIAVGLAGLGPIVFLIRDSAHTRRVRPVLDGIGTVLPLTGRIADDVDELRRRRPVAIMTFSELMLRATAAIAAAAGLAFHDIATARVLTDKVQQRERLRDAGVDQTRSYPLWTVDDWPPAVEHVGLPAVIKPVRGAASRFTHLVGDEKSGGHLVQTVLAEIGGPGSPLAVEQDTPPLVAEEYLRGAPDLPFGDYLSVESLCRPHAMHHLAITGKFRLLPPFREVGRFWPAVLSTEERDRVLDLTTRALTALGVCNGLTHTEIKLTAAGPRIIEVNGRLGGHVNGLARLAAGADLVRVAALSALGEPAPNHLVPPDRVHFQHHGLAPTVPCRLVAINGAREVRRLVGITGYRNFVRAGDKLPGGVLTNEMDVLWGACDNHDAMTAVLSNALTTLSYDFEFSDSVLRKTAAALLEWLPERTVLHGNRHPDNAYR